MPIMDGDYVGRRRGWQTVAVVLLVCSLAPSLTGFNLKGLSVKVAQDKQASEAAEMQVWSGSIFFNGEELNFQSGPLSAAATENDLYQPGGADLFEQTSRQPNDMANEAAWRRLNFSLQCGHSKMTLKAMGPGTGDLQLDMGNAHSIPLIRVPKTCGYSMHQNELGLVLVVRYNGCNVIQENGRYVLPMRWSESPVKFVCPMSPSPDTTTSEPAQQSRKFPLHRKLWNRLRSKRDANHYHSVFDPGSRYYHNLYNYYMYVMNTILTTNTQERLPGYPFYPNYIYYPYYPYYPPQNLPEMTTVSQATTGHGTTLNTPQKNPYYPMYYPYPHYQPEGQSLLQETPYHFGSPYPPINQNVQGKPQYPQTQNLPMQATEYPPTAGIKPPAAEPVAAEPAAAEPTTICAKRKYKTCAPKTATTDSGSDSGQQKPYVPLNQLPFAPYISYKAAGKVPGDQTEVPEAGGKNGIQAPEHGDADVDGDADADADAAWDGDGDADVDADADSFPDFTDEDSVDYD